jgi:hypothetical protein
MSYEFWAPPRCLPAVGIGVGPFRASAFASVLVALARLPAVGPSRHLARGLRWFALATLPVSIRSEAVRMATAG